MKSIVSLAALGACLLAAGASAQERPTIERGQSLQGRLEATDPALEEQEGVRYDDYRIRLRAGERVRLSLDSEVFDPILRIYAGDDLHEPLSENDDFGEALNSRLSFTAPAEGDYVVRVLSFDASETGPYILRAEAIAPLPAPVTLNGRRSRTTWRSHNGTLAAGDPDNDGKHFDDYQISLRQGETILIRLDSEAFDPMIQILLASDRDGGVEIDADDDAGPDLNALLGFRAPQSGDYIVRVTSFEGSARGPYRLSIAR
jgi:hypothetical protein